MRLFRWTTLAGTLIALGACTDVLNPGRCNQTSDCVGMASYGAGYVCNLDPNPQGNGRCVLKCASTSECQGGRICDFDSHNIGRCLFPTTDGGVDADGGDGGDTQMCPVCSGSTPVCVGFTCVECATSADCNSDPTKPICDTAAHTCGACTGDSQCADKLGPNPGVCMAHQDGHCATDAETVYVQNTTGCSDTGAGTAAAPFCSMTPAQGSIANSDAQTLVVVRGTVNGATTPFNRSVTRKEASIVGQQSAVIAAGAQPGLDVRNGLFYARDLKLSLSTVACINAVPTTGAAVTLRLDHVTVDSCQGGGIVIDGAGFDIRNTIVTNNGPGDDGGLPWGGMRIKNPPATSKHIELTTVRANNGGGISCGGMVDGVNVLVIDNVNTPTQIASACGFTSCAAASATCGAQ